METLAWLPLDVTVTEMLLSESPVLSVALKVIEIVEFRLILMQGETVAGLAVQLA